MKIIYKCSEIKWSEEKWSEVQCSERGVGGIEALRENLYE